MTRALLLPVMLLSFGCAATARIPAVPASAAPVGSPSKKMEAGSPSLRPFESVAQLREYTRGLADAGRAEQRRALEEYRKTHPWVEPPNPAPAAAPAEIGTTTETIQVSAASPTIDTSITNTQHAGVDEGGIVKRAGDVLVVLRRGRLFTIGIGDQQLAALDVADAGGTTPVDNEPYDTWYDELLVWERRVVVIGFSYRRRSTEVVLFDLGSAGRLSYRATYQLRTSDYYSGANYASRLIDSRLIMFTSTDVPEDAEPQDWLPAMRLRPATGADGPFVAIAPISRVLRPTAGVGVDAVAHALTTCDLAQPEFTCEATVVIGDSLQASYASPTAAYAWTQSYWSRGDEAMIYRIPYDGTPAAAIRAAGTPPDQFAFHEADDHLHVIVASRGDAMLLRIPIVSFADGSTTAPNDDDRLVAPGLGQWLKARFVGDFAIVGREGDSPGRIFVTPWRGGATVSLPLAHDVERIDALGAHAIVAGEGASSLELTAIALDGEPRVAGAMSYPGASQSESRSHAFFYRSDDRDTGIFGLPVVSWARDDRGRTRANSARIVFVHNRRLTFTDAGALASSAPHRDDGCRVSCVAWYGDARPVFLDGRVFALLGYELVEGRVVNGRVAEVSRLDFTPPAGGVR